MAGGHLFRRETHEGQSDTIPRYDRLLGRVEGEGCVVRWDRHVYDGWRCVFCDVNELDESIYGPFECVEHDGPVWVSESAGEAVQGVVDAWCDEGTHPAFHRDAQARLARQWPSLYSAIQELVKSNVIR